MSGFGWLLRVEAISSVFKINSRPLAFDLHFVMLSKLSAYSELDVSQPLSSHMCFICSFNLKEATKGSCGKCNQSFVPVDTYISDIDIYNVLKRHCTDIKALITRIIQANKGHTYCTIQTRQGVNGSSRSGQVLAVITIPILEAILKDIDNHVYYISFSFQRTRCRY